MFLKLSILLNCFFSYFTDEVSKGFQALYDNRAGSLDSLARHWAGVAAEFGLLEGKNQF